LNVKDSQWLQRASAVVLSAAGLLLAASLPAHAQGIQVQVEPGVVYDNPPPAYYQAPPAYYQPAPPPVYYPPPPAYYPPPPPAYYPPPPPAYYPQPHGYYRPGPPPPVYSQPAPKLNNMQQRAMDNCALLAPRDQPRCRATVMSTTR